MYIAKLDALAESEEGLRLLPLNIQSKIMALQNLIFKNIDAGVNGY